MKTFDDDLKYFEMVGAKPLPVSTELGYVSHKGAKIWYAAYGLGPPVILLHGGLGHSGNWGHQVPALLSAGYRVIVVDSRGHGRSTRDSQPFTYELLASDVLAIMNQLKLEKPALVGWSDGACITLTLASNAPEKIAGVFFFGCNMNPDGIKDFVPNPVLERCFNRHVQDYAQLSKTPEQFKAFSEAVQQMQKTQPDYSARQLSAISVPVVIVQSEHDEFIKLEHAQYLAQTIPEAEFILLPNVSHFAPLQRPELFNSVLLAFLRKVLPCTQ